MPQRLNTKILTARALPSPRASEIPNRLTNALDDLERTARRSNSSDTASPAHVPAASGGVVRRTVERVEMKKRENEHLNTKQ